MNYKTIGDYPSQLDDNQLKTYISILLNIADVDGNGNVNILDVIIIINIILNS